MNQKVRVRYAPILIKEVLAPIHYEGEPYHSKCLAEVLEQ